MITLLKDINHTFKQEGKFSILWYPRVLRRVPRKKKRHATNLKGGVPKKKKKEVAPKTLVAIMTRMVTRGVIARSI